ncbi:MAG: hypothetical protein JXA67_02105 [Micromonosporaceae bacterium]|nr:hypothetical protein [Micromonosporaceae bacterium]
MQDMRFPALTAAEQDLVEGYLRIIDVVGRLNPARDSSHQSTHGCQIAAQALVAAARDMLRTTETMLARGEDQLHPPTLAAAMLALDGHRRTARLLLRPVPHDPDAGRPGTDSSSGG